jgi:phenylalanyl-tRNA synthetase beta chain
MEGTLVGQILEIEKHPNADKLTICKVDVGQELPLQIICGAPNVMVGAKVIVATVGTTLPGPNGEGFKIGERKIRGIESFGMLCSTEELGYGKSEVDGIAILKEDCTIGLPFSLIKR